MSWSQQRIAIALVCAVAVLGSALGWWAPLDDALRDGRFALITQPSSGDIVFVEIDSNLLPTVPSSATMDTIYASAVNAVVLQGAERVVLDAPFARPRPGTDALAYPRLRDALEAAGGKARTTAVRLERGEDHGHMILPPPELAAVAPPVFVDASVRVRADAASYDLYAYNGRWISESLALALNPGAEIDRESFGIDFAINLDDIPRTTLSDVLTGTAPNGLFAGRSVLIGPASYAQQASHSAPRYGSLSTPQLQLLAAETIRQDRMLQELGIPITIAIIIAGGLVFSVLRPTMTLRAAIWGSVAYGGAIGFMAVALQVHVGLVLATGAIYVSQTGFILTAFWHELEHRGRTLTRAQQQRDSVRVLVERIVADNFDGVVVADRGGSIRAASRVAEDMLGADLVGRRCSDVLPGPLHVAVRQAMVTGDGSDRAIEVGVELGGEQRTVELVTTVSEVADTVLGRAAVDRAVCLTFRDVTDRRVAEDKLNYLASHDPLTGAASRPQFIDDIARYLKTPQKRVAGAAVYMVGLSRLKTVIDTLGHAYGDALLQQVVSRLELLAPLSVARLDGNTFGVFRAGLVSTEEAEAFARTLISELTRPYHLDDHHALVGARIGMSDSDLSGSAPEAIVSHASVALSLANEQSAGSVVVYAQNMDARIKTKREMELALRAALDNGELSVHYQPQVDLESGSLIGVEALTRWTHASLGNVPPSEFIPTAEETGLIIEMGRWVLDTACSEVMSWSAPVRLSVNVSPLQFEYGDIVSDVRAALEASGLPPERLELEITESLLVSEQCDVSNKLTELRSLGVRVALDDFGTGYSSLSYLGRLPVDTIKIDQSFVRGLPADTEATAIVRAVLMLSESLGKGVVAEGVETADQAWMLRLAGCRTGQGYHFARPGPAETIARLLEDDCLPMVKRD